MNPWPAYDPTNGRFRDDDVRRQCYCSVFAGGCGVIYGHRAVWQFWDKTRDNINHADRHWTDALDRPGAFQAGYLRRLVEATMGAGRVPDQTLLASPSGEGAAHTCAMRDSDGTRALIYTTHALADRCRPPGQIGGAARPRPLVRSAHRAGNRACRRVPDSRNANLRDASRRIGYGRRMRTDFGLRLILVHTFSI